MPALFKQKRQFEVEHEDFMKKMGTFSEFDEWENLSQQSERQYIYFLRLP